MVQRKKSSHFQQEAGYQSGMLLLMYSELPQQSWRHHQMSVDATVWARAQSGRIKTTATRLVLWAICFRADNDGYLKVPMTVIAADTGLEISNVWKRVKELREAGFLTRKNTTTQVNFTADTMAHVPVTMAHVPQDDWQACHTTMARVPVTMASLPQDDWQACHITMAHVPQIHGKPAMVSKDKTDEDCCSRKDQLSADVISLKGYQPEPMAQADSGQVVFNEGVDERSENHLTEIDGLNGSTSHLCKQLARWLAGDHYQPDIEAAHAMMQGNVIAYGAERVKAGMADLQMSLASGSCKQVTPRAIVGFIRNASTVGQAAQRPRNPDELNIQAIIGQSAGYANARPAD